MKWPNLLLLCILFSCQNKEISEQRPTPTPLPTVKASPIQTKADTAPLIRKLDKLNLKNANDLKKGMNIFKEILQLDPVNKQACEGIGLAMVALNDFTNAPAILETCLTKNKKSENCHHALYIYYSHQNNLLLVDRLTTACLSALPRSNICLRNRAIFLLSQKKFDLALTLFKKIEANHLSGEKQIQDLGVLYYSIALTHENLGQVNEAANYYQKSCQEKMALACQKVDK